MMVGSASLTSFTLGGTNNSFGTAFGTASVTIDGATTTNPVQVSGFDGTRLMPAEGDQFGLAVYAVGANPMTDSPVYYVNEVLTKGNVTTTTP
jgi:hypothetical protein